mmetsp:Transcript_22248/g.53276  ORF Transcript_22248/g.53276 Transcript_22248/m.53276 type:complete len:129 (-) Transcript_22248:37-423(-)
MHRTPPMMPPMPSRPPPPPMPPMAPCLQDLPAKNECDEKCDTTRKTCRQACSVDKTKAEKKQCKIKCKITKNSCKSSCVRCEFCEDANLPSDPEYCSKELGSFIDRIIKCKGPEFIGRCQSSCGLCHL